MRAVPVLALLLPILLAGCADAIRPGGDVPEPEDTTPTFPVRVVDAGGAPVHLAQVCVKPTRAEAVAPTPDCKSTGQDGRVAMPWPCTGACSQEMYVGAAWRDPGTGRTHSSAETVAVREMPTSDVVLYIIR